MTWRSLGVVMGVGLVVLAGCTKPMVITKTIQADRDLWVRLERDPSLPNLAPVPRGEYAALHDGLTAATLSAWMRGFQVETDRGPVGMMFGRPGERSAFVEPEIAALTPYLAKGLQLADASERVAYCMTVDYSPRERFITTGWMRLSGPYLLFRIIEYRTPVSVDSPMVSSVEACQVKPIPGVKTADRFFKLDYQPHEVVVPQGLTAGFMSGADRNAAGEIVFSIPRLLKQDASAERDQGRHPDGVPRLPGTDAGTGQPAALGRWAKP